jgi:phosphatidylglycerol lysyltransferase
VAAIDDSHEHARALVLRHGWNPAAYQILNPGMGLWFSAARDAVAGYAAYRDTWVVAGAPVCAEDRLPDVARELDAHARRQHKRLLYFGAGARLERLLGAAGEDTHHLLRLGAQPVWDPSRWKATIRARASIRAQINRARNKGVRIRKLDFSREPEILPRLRAVQEGWLATRGLPQLHFMTETDILRELRDRQVFAAERDGQLIAFAVATPVPARNGWLLEQWPRLPTAPNGTTVLLVHSVMSIVASEGARFVTLGLAPLSDRAGLVGEGEPLWVRGLLRWIRAHGRRFYNFRGLDAFKASLAPDAWEPAYAIIPGHGVTPGALTAVAGVFGGGSPLALVARAVWMAVRREAHTLLREDRRQLQIPRSARDDN